MSRIAIAWACAGLVASSGCGWTGRWSDFLLILDEASKLNRLTDELLGIWLARSNLSWCWFMAKVGGV